MTRGTGKGTKGTKSNIGVRMAKPTFIFVSFVFFVPFVASGQT